MLISGAYKGGGVLGFQETPFESTVNIIKFLKTYLNKHIQLLENANTSTFQKPLCMLVSYC